MKDNKYKYQIVVVLNPKTEEKEKETLIKKIVSQIEENQGVVANKNHMGPKDLVYEIAGFNKGDFWVFDVEADKPMKHTEFNLFLNREIKVIRYLILKK